MKDEKKADISARPLITGLDTGWEERPAYSTTN
jgi:hypothetical protein